MRAQVMAWYWLPTLALIPGPACGPGEPGGTRDEPAPAIFSEDGAAAARASSCTTRPPPPPPPVDCHRMVCTDGTWEPRPVTNGTPCRREEGLWGRCHTDGGDTECRAVLNCPGGQSVCGTTCADLGSDPAHCGGCGNACPVGATCVQGQCNPAFCAPNDVCAPTPTGNQCVCPVGATCKPRCGPPICWLACGPTGCVTTCGPPLCTVDNYCQ